MNSLSLANRQPRNNPVRDNAPVFLLLSGQDIKTLALLSRLYALSLSSAEKLRSYIPWQAFKKRKIAGRKPKRVDC
jgi:hypothetical protein